MSEFWSKIKTDEGEETIPLLLSIRIHTRSRVEGISWRFTSLCRKKG